MEHAHIKWCVDAPVNPDHVPHRVDEKKSAGNREKIVRDAQGRYVKGSAAPPGVGRPPGALGLAGQMRKAMDDGKLIWDYLRSVIDGSAPKASHRDRMEAAKIALERGWGRAVETSVQVTLDARQGQDLDLSDEQLKYLADVLMPRGDKHETGQLVMGRVVSSAVVEPDAPHKQPITHNKKTEAD